VTAPLSEDPYHNQQYFTGHSGHSSPSSGIYGYFANHHHTTPSRRPVESPQAQNSSTPRASPPNRSPASSTYPLPTPGSDLPPSLAAA
jgi:hypothetical protein